MARVSSFRDVQPYAGPCPETPRHLISTLSALAGHSTYSADVGRELLSTLAELYQFASWTAFDAGRLGRARQLALSAANAANQAGNRTLGATALSELSYLTASSSDPGEGVAMARASLANVPRDMLSAVRVVLADRLAWASARTGDRAGVARALGMSEEAHDQRDSSSREEPDTVYWINRDESQIMAGRCWAELGSDRAAPTLEAVEPPYDDTHARESALYASWLAGAHLSAGDIDRAAVEATRAVHLSHNTASPRTSAMLRDTLAAFEPYRGVSEVDELLMVV